MNTNKQEGTTQLSSRLVVIIDSILDAIWRNSGLTNEEKRKLSEIVVTSGHESIREFIYGIEDESAGIKILYNDTELNDESFEMPDLSREIDFIQFSRFESTGILKTQ